MQSTLRHTPVCACFGTVNVVLSSNIHVQILTYEACSRYRHKDRFILGSLGVSFKYSICTMSVCFFFLLLQMSNEIIRLCCREISLDRIFQGYVISSKQILNDCIQCCLTWKELYLRTSQLHHKYSSPKSSFLSLSLSLSIRVLLCSLQHRNTTLRTALRLHCITAAPFHFTRHN